MCGWGFRIPLCSAPPRLRTVAMRTRRPVAFAAGAVGIKPRARCKLPWQPEMWVLHTRQNANKTFALKLPKTASVDWQVLQGRPQGTPPLDAYTAGRVLQNSLTTPWKSSCCEVHAFPFWRVFQTPGRFCRIPSPTCSP